MCKYERNVIGIPPEIVRLRLDLKIVLGFKCERENCLFVKKASASDSSTVTICEHLNTFHVTLHFSNLIVASMNFIRFFKIFIS